MSETREQHFIYEKRVQLKSTNVCRGQEFLSFLSCGSLSKPVRSLTLLVEVRQLRL